MEEDFFPNPHLPFPTATHLSDRSSLSSIQKMEEDFFENLPSEIITNILLRLTVRTIAITKCVCKSWFDLLESDEFVNSHLSRTAAAVAIFKRQRNSSRCTIFNLEDEIIDIESHRYFRRNHLTKFNFPHTVKIKGSANGMLLLHKYEVNFHALYVCNPISREYIELHCSQEFFNILEGVAYGFGVSRITGQYKVVQIRSSNRDCHVYTLGTGSWRRVEAPRVFFHDDFGMFGALVNGNLHWLVHSNGVLCVSCFDLETECFSTFFVPPFKGYISNDCYRSLSVLRDCLCVCDDTHGDEFIIWMMKEYGDEKSWRKEYVIDLTPADFDSCAYFLKVFNDGDILMVLDERYLSYYSNETKTIREVGVFDYVARTRVRVSDTDVYTYSMLLTPSFLSLKSFPMENVISL